MTLNTGCQIFEFDNQTIRLRAGTLFAIDFLGQSINPIGYFQQFQTPEASYALWNVTTNELEIVHDLWGFMIRAIGEHFVKSISLSKNKCYGRTGDFMLASYISEPKTEFYEMFNVTKS